MILQVIPVGLLEVNCYTLGCERTRQGMVIDPGDNAPAILALLRSRDLSLMSIVATHAHFDHLLACRALQELTGASFYLHPGDRPLLGVMRRTCLAWLGYDPGEPPEVTGDLVAGQMLQAGEVELEIRHTPGHSPGSITLVDHAGRRAFSGDALFAGSIGRTDLPGGSMETLLSSVREHILDLPGDYVILPGHGPATTVDRERRTNPFFDTW